LQAALEAERNAGEINRYMGLIQQKVNRKWLRPAGAGANLKCRLRLRLAPGGNVIGVSILESSGNGAFDRSAEAAVLKAEPLPVPGGNLFEQFRDINFLFDPN
jgi:colicin import membrane protein